MYKSVVIGIVSAGGAGAVGVGGYALFGNGFGGGSDTTSSPKVDEASTPEKPNNTVAKAKITQKVVISAGDTTYEDKLEKLDALSEAVKGGECFTNAFGENLSFESSGASDSIQWTTIDFGNPIVSSHDTEQSKKYTGCARVQARKVTFSEGGSSKYTGVFSWVWAFKGTTKAFAFFGVAQTNEQQKNLDVEGVVYLMDKQTNDDTETWKVTHKKESGKKILSSGEAGNKLPVPNTTYLSGDLENHADWHWLNTHQLGNIANSDATDGKQESVAHTPRWSHSSSSTDSRIYEGCTNLNGGDHLFDNTSSTLAGRLTSWTGGGG